MAQIFKSFRSLSDKTLQLTKPKKGEAKDAIAGPSSSGPDAEDLMLEVFPPLGSRDEIRLVTLEPSEHLNAIPVCDLKVVRLGSHPVFEALSWAWGERWQETRQDIYFQQRPWSISKNLYEALTNLRRPDRSRILWFDALCINQSTSEIALEERAQQIRLMRHIYSFASHVVIWMGTPQEELTDFFLETLQNGDFVEASATESERTYAMLNGILGNSWWKRLWVLQESTLPEMSSIQHGHVTVSFRDFLDNLRNLELHLQPEAYDSEAWRLKMNIHRYIRLYTIMQKHVAASELLEGRRQLTPGRDPVQDPGITCAQLNSFVTVLWECRHQLTTDPRDKIYGLLGLVDDSVASLIEPSYTEEVAHIYARSFGVIAHNTQSLAFLAIVAKKSKSKQPKLSLASWAPDLTRSFTDQELSRDARLELVIKQMSLSNESHENNSIAFDGIGVLQTRGLKIDRIKLAGGEMPGLATFQVMKVALSFLWAARLYVLLGRQLAGKELKQSGAFWEWYNRKLIDIGSWYTQKEFQKYGRFEAFSSTPPGVDDVLSQQSMVPEHRPAHQQHQHRHHHHHHGEKRDWKEDMKYITSGSFYSAYWKMLCHGHDSWSNYSSESSYVPLWDRLAQHETFEIPGTEDQYSDAIIDHLRTTMENRRFFLTDDGFLGNASDAAEGDVVFTLRGARLPVVLRPKPGQPCTYKFVGECYVPGVMRNDESAWIQASFQRRRWMQTKLAELGQAGMDRLHIQTDLDLEETVLLE